MKVLPYFIFFASSAIAVSQNETAPKFTAEIPAAASKNLIPNASFEIGKAGWSSFGDGVGLHSIWAPQGDGSNWGNMELLHGKIESGDAPHGKKFLRIPLGQETQTLYFDYFEPLTIPQLRPLAANKGWIPVDPAKKYTLSCMLRTNKAGVPALIGVHAQDPQGKLTGMRAEQLQPVTLGTQWKRYTFTFKPEHPYVFVTIGPNLKKNDDVYVDLDAVQLEQADNVSGFESRQPVEIGITTSTEGGIYYYGEKAFLEITAHNHSAKEQEAALTFEVKDFFGNGSTLEPLTLVLQPGETSNRQIPLPETWKGFFYIQTGFSVGQQKETGTLRVAFVPKRSGNDSFLGINHVFPDDFLMLQASKAGVTWYRDWSFKWQHTEPKKGKFNWALSAPQIDRVRKFGAKVMTLLPPFPSSDWSSEAPKNLVEKARERSKKNKKISFTGENAELPQRMRWAYAPENPKDLADYSSAVVKQYKDRIQYWEFLNEALHGTYSLPGKDRFGAQTYKAEDYVKLLAVLNEAVHKTDPNAKVIGGPGYQPGKPYTLQAIAAGALKHCDIFNLHNYPGQQTPEELLEPINRTLKAMEENGGIKPIWITEYSYFGVDDKPRTPFEPDPLSWSENRFLTEKQVADYNVRYFTIMLSRHVEKIFIHSGATGAINNPSGDTCLFAYGGAPRKAFPAMAVFTEILGAKPKAAAEKISGDRYVFAFETPSQSVVVLWQAKGEAEIQIPEGTKALDLMGNELTAVSLSESPVYLIGKTGEAKKLVEALP